MSAHIEEASVLSGRSLVLLASFAVPMLFLYGLARNIGVFDFEPIPVMKGSFFEPEPTRPPPTVEQYRPAPLPGTERTQVVVNRPEVVFPVDDPVVTRTQEPPSLSGGAGGGTEAAPIPPTSLNFVAQRPSDEFYPPISLRMGEQGITVIRICVTAAGSLQGVPAVTSSSGHKRLDAAAVTWASEALRFEPATQNGAAVTACKGVRVNFRLR